MSANQDTGQNRCLFCNKSVRRGPRRNKPPKRSYALNESFFNTYPYILDYVPKLPNLRMISADHRICRPCLQRVGRAQLKKERIQITQSNLPNTSQMNALVRQTLTNHSSQQTISQMDVPVQSELSTTTSTPASPASPGGSDCGHDNDACQEIGSAIFYEPSTTDFLDIKMEDPLNIEQNEAKIHQYLDIEVPDIKLDNIPNSPRSLEVAQDVPLNATDTQIPVPGFKRTSLSSSICLIIQCKNKDLHRVSTATRTNVLAIRNIYIPKGSRVCLEHINSNVWNNIEQHSRHIYETFSSAQISDMLKMLQKRKNMSLNFENMESMDEEEFQYFTGYNKSNFIRILNSIPPIKSLITNNPVKKQKTFLAALLTKIHTGDSNDQLSCIFRVSQQHFGRMLKTAKTHLLREFELEKLVIEHSKKENTDGEADNDLSNPKDGNGINELLRRIHNTRVHH